MSQIKQVKSSIINNNRFGHIPERTHLDIIVIWPFIDSLEKKTGISQTKGGV